MISLRSPSKLMAMLGLEPKCWGPALANLPMAFGGTVSQDWGGSEDQTWAMTSSSKDQNLAGLRLRTHGQCLSG